MRSVRGPGALLALPALIYVAIAATWAWSHIYAITGDEPHYLLVSDSLVRDHDVRVENNYLIDTPVHRAYGFDLTQPVHGSHRRNGFSAHGIGLPIVLTLPYAVAGPAGARVFMAVMAGLIPFLVYRAASPVMTSPRLRTGLALAVSLGLPFMAAGNQIFPDIPGGMLLLYGAGSVALALRAESGEATRSGCTVFVVAAILPWLHAPLGARDLLLSSWVLAVAGRERRVALVLPLVGVVASFIGVAVYNHVAFGHARGVYGPESLTTDPRQIAMILLGLHFDETQGCSCSNRCCCWVWSGSCPDPARASARGADRARLRVDRRAERDARQLVRRVLLRGRFAWAGILLWTFPMAAAIRSSAAEALWLSRSQRASRCRHLATR
jgi:hypothetical protein